MEDAAFGRPTTTLRPHGRALDTLVPDNPEQALRHQRAIKKIVDDGKFFEIQSDFAQNIVVGFARWAVTASASSPTSRWCSPACSTSSQPERRRASSASATPSTSRSSSFEDVPGFLPGKDQEWGGIIRHGAKLLYAFCEATVPKITVITRKAYGGAYAS
jgi:propionyl-CoA carboxylase beta chain